MHPKHTPQCVDDPNPSGLCQCGCGQPTAIVKRSQRGYLRGHHSRYLRGHHRVNTAVKYLVQDAGYDTPCWIWQRSTNFHGYGKLGVNGRTVTAYRYNFEEAFGPIPKGYDLDHLCRNRLCVNPAHLQPVPHAVNCQRGAIAKLSVESVIEIRRSANTASVQELARRFGVSVDTIHNVIRRKTWRNVEDHS